jgi:ubiquinone/menaquinone biosynthesis C-methylase UbiE
MPARPPKMKFGFPSSESSSHIRTVWEITSWLRRATILLAADRSGLKAYLDQSEFVSDNAVDDTAKRMLKAGTILGLFNCNGTGSYSWNHQYSWARTESSNWKHLIAIIRHQLSYMNLVDDADFWCDKQFLPVDQLARDPAAYEAFLHGVEESHRQHAQWLAQVDDLKLCRSMADLGGGLGTFAMAWVRSSQTRRATIVDFPGVRVFLDDLLQQYNERLSFIGADLNVSFNFPGTFDFVLCANVLHLILRWPTLLEHMASTLAAGTLVGIFEADPDTAQGALFDLQVHLRSGRVASLLKPASIRKRLEEGGFENIRRVTTIDPEDPFRREYGLWLGKVPKRSNRRHSDQSGNR